MNEPVRKMIDHKTEDIFFYASQILSPADQLSILASVCIAYFVLEQWENAERLLMQIKEQKPGNQQGGYFIFFNVVSPGHTLEGKEWIRLDNNLEAAYHFLYARKKTKTL